MYACMCAHEDSQSPKPNLRFYFLQLQWSDSKVRYITSLKRGDMGIRGKIH